MTASYPGYRRTPPYRLIGPGRPGRPRTRLAITWMFAMLAAGGLVARLVTLQVSPDQEFISWGEDQRIQTIEQTATRGSIVDRNGTDLALSVAQTSIVFDSRLVTDPLGDAAKLAPILGADQATIQGLLASGKSYVYLARLLDDDTTAAVKTLDLPYLRFIAEDKRFLPSGDLFATSILGRTDGFKKGISGIEKSYDEVLRGTDGTLVIEQGVGGRTIPGGEQQLDPAIPGSDVVLAIDRGLQFEVERLLMQAVDEAGAAGGTILVSNPETGEVLVDANVVRPTLTPDESADDAQTAATQLGPAQPARENRALSWTYEPGSINKVITMAGVLEEGLATPETVQPVSSSVEYIGKRFLQESRSTDEDLSLRQILARSDNVGTINWAEQLGEERLNRYLRAFGLGEMTTIDWEYQSSGSIAPLDKWSDTSLPTFAIGQGLAVTPMQMLGVYNAIANDGVLAPSRLVLGTASPDGEFTPTAVPEPRRVISAATSAALRDMLTTVVTDGTGKNAQVDGYTVAGKTGTAWEPVPGGGYGTRGTRHLATSFVGFLPASDPKLTISVVIDDPADELRSSGGSVAAPLFQKVASYAVGHLRIPPDGGTTLAGAERVRAEPVAAPAASTIGTSVAGDATNTGLKPK